MVERMGEGRQSGLMRMGTMVGDEDGGKDNDGSDTATKDTMIDMKES
jgi:hypothetical protein